MTAAEYRALRRTVLDMTQQELADALGVHVQTIAKRERGQLPISVEAMRAIRDVAREVRG